MTRPKLRRWAAAVKVACWSLLVSALLFSSPAAFAHAKLLRSQPTANSRSEQPPALIELWFNEKPEPGFNTIEVKDARGERFDRGGVTLAEGGKKAQVELEALEVGKYTCVWKVLSGDGHTIRGRFTFAVTTTAASAATPEASPSPAQQAGEQSSSQPAGPGSQEAAPPGEDSAGESSVTWVYNLTRWLTYLAMMTLFGGFAFHLFVLAPALRRTRAGDGDEGGKRIGASARRVVRLSWASVVLLGITSVAALILQVSAVFDKPLGESLSPSLLGQVITRTGYGAHWLLQALTAAAVAVILFLLNARLKREPSGGHVALWWSGLIAGAVLLVAPSWTGHAAASVREYRFAVVADWLHILAGGFWVGGLFHLALTLGPALASLGGAERTRALHRVITRFTRMAISCVALLALADLYNAWIHVESFPALWGTSYGRMLLVKLLLVALMLLVGAANNFHFGRRAARLSEAAGDAADSTERERLGRGFSRAVALEAAIGVAVLLVTSFLVFLTPARSHPAMSAAATAAAVSQDGK